MPSKMQAALDKEVGQQLLDELRTYGGQADGAVDGIVQIARNYALFRSKIDGDADEVAFADASFSVAVSDNQPKIASLTESEKQWVDAFMAGLGYSPTV